VLAEHPTPATDALLIVDMISRWDFPDAERLLRRAAAVAPNIARLAARCRRQRVPVIYANDNRGDWRSDYRQVLQHSLDAGGQAAAIAQLLTPDECDHVVLKPRHSAFHATPLLLLLQHLGVERVIVCGSTSDQCVLATALDAQVRGLQVVVPSDGCATKDAGRQRRLLALVSQALEIPTPSCARVRLQ
jgi:nicotinamidase-related amidase